MLVGAALAAGASLPPIRDALVRLGLPGLEVELVAGRRGGLAGRHFVVRCEDGQAHRGLSQIREIVRRGSFGEEAEGRILACFERLAEAEASVHGIDVEEVHFHEVGALDAIADVCAAVLAFEQLGLERLSCQEVVTGFGTVRCAHGELPVPAPATLRILAGVPMRTGTAQGEACTPTGAALLRTLVTDWGPAPAMRGSADGYGLGTRDVEGRPNVVRLRIGETLEELGAGTVWELRLQVDNCSGELIGQALERAMEAGALDVMVLPGSTKKSRPAQLLIALVEEERREALEELLLSELPTLGLRRVRCERQTLERWVETRATEFGELRFKVRRLPGGQELAHPEADEVARVAREHALPAPVVLARLQQGGR